MMYSCSYEFTNKKMMVVDIQGVDDKYTDPQIHTADGQGITHRACLLPLPRVTLPNRCGDVVGVLTQKAAGSPQPRL